MKIAVISNFDNENFDEYFVAYGLSDHNGPAMCKRLNEHPAAGYDPGFYKAVPDDYELKVFKP